MRLQMASILHLQLEALHQSISVFSFYTALMVANGASLAGNLQTKAEARGATDVRIAEANDVTLDEAFAYPNVAFILATAGQGEACGNAKTFCDSLISSKAKVSSSFGVFGLGDSHYWGTGTADSAKYFASPPKISTGSLKALGAHRLVDVGLGDDQHPDGYNGAYGDWEIAFLGALGLKPVPGEEEAAKRAKGGLPADDILKSETNYLRGTIAKGLEDRSTRAMLPGTASLPNFTASTCRTTGTFVRGW